ncbi:nuclear cap-binding protein [Histoplasma capsulatum G186AR]|uniref:Nuclear cap-binding protein n=2 Tax=Ajellomyces capsulatus TaxID=5037 RepID=C0NCW4_AJECG|nr:nuclear cap-binding protein [Histoplasma capsulatum G186AR]EEH11505.1 nuclear cap-binding protein [Histoplasma capsulatum G186AR]KAG5302650.1 nuclear cap-binding protein [Histoplasma capsulatum]QSS71949.1 nuclear cap-binding protein [Histoplasma capsulatum G186AR]
MSESSRLKNTIYVGGLDQSVTLRTLTEAFLPFGEIADISLPKPEAPSSTDLHRGFGYVEFEDPQDAKEAIDNMDQSELYGRIIKVAAAKPQKDSNEGLGSKTAIWQQEGYLAQHAVSEEDRVATGQGGTGSSNSRPEDPMQGLEGLDVAGPKPE